MRQLLKKGWICEAERGEERLGGHRPTKNPPAPPGCLHGCQAGGPSVGGGRGPCLGEAGGWAGNPQAVVVLGPGEHDPQAASLPFAHPGPPCSPPAHGAGSTSWSPAG